jgi:hypothetical protein
MILRKVFLPMSHGITLSKKQYPSTPDEQDRMRVIPYALAIGSIMYDMLYTHPDVSYALSAMRRYQSNYGEAYWSIVKNIIKYLRRTKEVLLVFGGQDELVVKGYTYASFQINTDDSKLQFDFVFCLNEGAVSWKSSKQDIAASKATNKAVWIRNFVSELGVVPDASNSMNLYYDNSEAIVQAKEPRSHKKSKYVLRRYHLICEIINQGDVKVYKMHTDQNVTDPLTKPLPQPKHEVLDTYMSDLNVSGRIVS